MGLLRPWFTVSAALSLAGVVAWMEFLSGIEISLSIFYLIPVILATRGAGRRGGLFLSATCVVLWLLEDHFLRGHIYSNPSIPFWNAAVRLGFFVLVTELLVRWLQAEEALRRSHDELEERVLMRTRSLQEANARLQEMDQLKSEFLKVISHELRTPLNAVIGFTELLRGEASGPVNEEQRLHLDYVLGSGRHLLAVIDDILLLSRIEAGKAIVNREPVVIGPLISHILDVQRPELVRRGLSVHVEGVDALPDACTDERMVSHILSHLLSNAIKFTSVGGVKIAGEAGEHRLEVSISDSGPGIPAEDLARLFVPFGQLDSSTSRRHEGIGVGLYLSKRQANLLGGDIEVASTPGAGATFTLVLPLRFSCDHGSARKIQDTGRGI